jgi:hypothetical protein
VPFATGRFATGLRWQAIGPEGLHASSPGRIGEQSDRDSAKLAVQQEVSLSYKDVGSISG